MCRGGLRWLATRRSSGLAGDEGPCGCSCCHTYSLDDATSWGSWGNSTQNRHTLTPEADIFYRNPVGHCSSRDWDWTVETVVWDGNHNNKRSVFIYRYAVLIWINCIFFISFFYLYSLLLYSLCLLWWLAAGWMQAATWPGRAWRVWIDNAWCSHPKTCPCQPWSQVWGRQRCNADDKPSGRAKTLKKFLSPKCFDTSHSKCWHIHTQSSQLFTGASTEKDLLQLSSNQFHTVPAILKPRSSILVSIVRKYH